MSTGSQNTYRNITAAVFECIKAKSVHEHGTVYDPPYGDHGIATTKIPVIGTVVLRFDFDLDAQTLTYTIAQKPGFVPESQIWSGIQATIEDCG